LQVYERFYFVKLSRTSRRSRSCFYFVKLSRSSRRSRSFRCNCQGYAVFVSSVCTIEKVKNNLVLPTRLFLEVNFVSSTKFKSFDKYSIIGRHLRCSFTILTIIVDTKKFCDTIIQHDFLFVRSLYTSPVWKSFYMTFNKNSRWVRYQNGAEFVGDLNDFKRKKKTDFTPNVTFILAILPTARLHLSETIDYRLCNANW